MLARPRLAPAGDPFVYWAESNLLAEGKGWIQPFIYVGSGRHVQSASLPPLYTMLQTLISLAGLKTFFAHRVWTAILSTAAVPMSAVVGRDIAGRRVGVVAAVLAAVYPNMWMSAGLAMSEAISPVLVLVVLWAAYRMWRRPGWREAVVLGGAIGFAALARDELIVFAPLVLLPMAIGPAGRPWSRRWRLLVAGSVGVIVIVGPWVTFNMTRFSHPVLITDRFGVALASANCDGTWNGPLAGYWSMTCADSAIAGVHGDESAEDAAAMRHALHYVDHHLSGLPAVEAKRLGRTFGFYQPAQQIRLDVFVEDRPRLWAEAGLWMFYALSLLSLWGAGVLKRKGVPLYPLGAVLADVVLVTLVTYGNTRFRATLEPVLVLLAATALVDLTGRALRPRPAIAPRRRRAPAGFRERSAPTSVSGPVRSLPAAGGA